jgi:hypothetical protein
MTLHDSVESPIEAQTANLTGINFQSIACSRSEAVRTFSFKCFENKRMAMPWYLAHTPCLKRSQDHTMCQCYSYKNHLSSNSAHHTPSIYRIPRPLQRVAHLVPVHRACMLGSPAAAVDCQSLPVEPEVHGWAVAVDTQSPAVVAAAVCTDRRAIVFVVEAPGQTGR